MVVHPVHNEVWEQWVFPLCLEEVVEQPEAVLAKVVSEYFETHQSLVLVHTLSEESQTKVVDIIVSHIQVNKRFIYWEGLSNSLSSKVTALIIGDM